MIVRPRSIALGHHLHLLGFELDEELSMVRDSARDFADGVLAPLATKHDREETISDDVYKQLGELGFWGLTLPEEFGGADLGNVALAVVRGDEWA